MRYYLRVFGWLLCGMGAVLGGLGALALAGVMRIQIEFFGRDLDTRPERIVWVAAWLAAIVVGLGLLRLGGARDQERSPK